MHCLPYQQITIIRARALHARDDHDDDTNHQGNEAETEEEEEPQAAARDMDELSHRSRTFVPVQQQSQHGQHMLNGAPLMGRTKPVRAQLDAGAPSNTMSSASIRCSPSQKHCYEGFISVRIRIVVRSLTP